MKSEKRFPFQMMFFVGGGVNQYIESFQINSCEKSHYVHL